MSVENVAEKYSLYQFTLIPASETTPSTQSSVRIGEYTDIEEAFSSASKTAYNELRNTQVALRYAGEKDKLGKLHVKSTEHGYDIICGYTVLSRLWIHISVGA